MWFEFSNAQSQAEVLAEDIAACLQRLLQKQPKVVLAVSGGQSPKAMFECLAKIPLPWEQVVVQWVDERMVPRHHPDSNSQLIESNLLQHCAQQAHWHNVLPVLEQFHSLNEQEEQAVLQDALNRYQVVDIAVLGMGIDGHFASLFVDAPEYLQAMDLHTSSPLMLVQPQWAVHHRITMTMPAILACKHLFLATYGAEKRALLLQIQQGSKMDLPIAKLWQASREQPLDVYTSE